MKILNELVELAPIEVQRYSVCDGWIVVDEGGRLVTYEAFRALAQRAEAAWAKLSELEQQEPVAYWHRSGQVVTREESHNDKIFAICCKVERPLFTRPTPAADLAELVPGNDLLRVLDFAKFVIKCVRKNGEYAPLSSQEPNEIDAILHKIEEAK